MPTLQILLRVTMVSFSSSCVRLYLIRRLKGKKCLSSFLKKLERRGVFNAASFYQSHRNNIMRHGTSLPFTDYFTEVCSNCCCSLCGTNTQQLICASGISVFRWFKFTLKPPYRIAIGNFFSAIWDTSHWNFLVKFGLKTAWDMSYDILLSLLKFVNFWRLQGCLSILAKIGCLQKIKVFSMKERQGFDATRGF